MVIEDASEPGGEILLCEKGDDAARLTSDQAAVLFQVTSKNATPDPKHSYAEGEQTGKTTCKSSLQVRDEGGRTMERQVWHYRLEAAPAVGFRRLSCSGGGNHSEMPNSSFQGTHPLFFPFTRYPAYHCVP